MFRDASEYRWVRESRFQRDLHDDNIDSDIVQEELQELRADHTTLT